MDTIILITAIIEVITLICFFNLCGTVSSIKRRIGGTETARMDKFNVYLVTGQIDKAKEVLTDMILSEKEWEQVANFSCDELKEQARKSLTKKYEKLLDAVDLRLNFDELEKIKTFY